MWWLVGAAYAACESRVPLKTLEDAVTRGDTAVAALDPIALQDAVQRIDDAARCLSVIAPASTVAHVYGLHGIRAFVAGDTQTSVTAFAVARSLGGWSPPESLAGPLLLSWEASKDRPPGTPRPLNLWPGFTWAVNGAAATEAPDGRPFLLQRVAPDGSVVEGALLEPGAGLPRPPVPAPPPVAAVPVAPAPAPAPAPAAVRKSHTSIGLAAGGGAALLAGGVFGAVATSRRAAYNDQRFVVESEELAAYRRVNAVGYPAYGLLVVGAGLGLGAVVVGQW